MPDDLIGQAVETLEVQGDPQRYFEGKAFRPALLGGELRQQYAFKTPCDLKEPYYFNAVSGIWQPAEIFIRTHAQKKLGIKTEKTYLNEVVEYICNDSRTTESTVVDGQKSYKELNIADLEPPVNLIPLENGIFNYETEELTPYTPDYFFTHKHPITYDPLATCPEIDKFFQEIASNNDDIETFKELFAYCLYRAYPIQKAIMLRGSGANGKSTFLNLLTAFLGKQNVAGETLQSLCYGRFSAFHLFHKNANIYPDLQKDAIESTGSFKALTGEDYIHAEIKFSMKRVDFYNYAKHVFSANELPEVQDNTDAFFRRWLIILFGNTFNGTNCDPFKLQKITAPTELSGLFNLSIKTLKELLQRGSFSGSKSIAEMEEEWKRQSDPLWAFVLDAIVKDTEGEVGKDELYATYQKYCEDKDYAVLDKATFAKKINQKTGAVAIRHQKPVKKHVWRGIRLKYAQAEGEPDGQTALSG